MAALRAAGVALLRPGRGAEAAARLGYHKKVRVEGPGGPRGGGTGTQGQAVG